MYRTHTCGELRIQDKQKDVILSGWVQKIRNLGAMSFVDLRDRYGITQLFFDKETKPELHAKAENLGREFVIQVFGRVTERSSKNTELPTGEIEIIVNDFKILSKSEIPPFTIEDNTDGGEELRLKYRYLDLRRPKVQKGIILRNRMAQEVRKYLTENGFLEIETPFLIKSTPEGARDFVVPSRMSPGKFYALPQSPQMFKQLLMISGYDKYFQLTKCFRDEDFRADRQPEFTQIDCEMAFVERDDILNMFEGLVKHMFSVIKNIEFKDAFPKMSYDEAVNTYGTDRPDIRFEMKIKELTDIVKGKNFKVFDDAEYIGGICLKGQAEYTRKQIDELTLWVQRPQIGAKGLIYVKYNNDGSLKSSIDKFYTAEDLKVISEKMNAQPGDLILIMSGIKRKTLIGLGELRLEIGKPAGLGDVNTFAPLWVVDFPLFEKDEETGQLHAVHHPFTSPKKEQIDLMDTHPEKIYADAYDLVVNGNEIGGGSIRIFDTELQRKAFKILGFTDESAKAQFGFLMNAFNYGAPPHGGIAFGFDRWTALFNGSDSIRDVIAFPKNNAGRDLMIDAPSEIDAKQLDELSLTVSKKN
jgi:aspartyl-tRNA synthetase